MKWKMVSAQQFHIGCSKANQYIIGLNTNEYDGSKSQSS